MMTTMRGAISGTFRLTRHRIKSVLGCTSTSRTAVQRLFSKTSPLSGDKPTLPEQDQTTIFDKIIGGQIPSKKVYEDDDVLAFEDISPQAPVHILLIPKKKDGLSMLQFAESRHVEILGKLLVKTVEVAKIAGLDEGYRVVINNGKHGQQTVYHLHLHLIGGRQLKWPPG